MYDTQIEILKLFPAYIKAYIFETDIINSDFSVVDKKTPIRRKKILLISVKRCFSISKVFENMLFYILF